MMRSNPRTSVFTIAKYSSSLTGGALGLPCWKADRGYLVAGATVLSSVTWLQHDAHCACHLSSSPKSRSKVTTLLSTCHQSKPAKENAEFAGHVADLSQPKLPTRWPHIPVLEQEVLNSLKDHNLTVFVDGTVGAGGHSSAILAQHPELQHLVAVDLDLSALDIARLRIMGQAAAPAPPPDADAEPVGPKPIHSASSNHNQELAAPLSPSSTPPSWSSPPPRDPPTLPLDTHTAPCGLAGAALSLTHDGPSCSVPLSSSCTLHLVHSNFASLPHICRSLGLPSVDGILLDLGVSSMQVDRAERGFSFLRDGPLDMRMDPQSSLSAAVVVNEWPEAELGRVLREWGEERQWRLLARRIVEARRVQRIQTTTQLADILSGGRGRSHRHASSGRGRGRGHPGLHPATRAFQALRIAVNAELSSLASTIPAAAALLSPGGRLVAISFHSLEDRIVKHSFLEAARSPDEGHSCFGITRENGHAVEDCSGRKAFRVVTPKPLVASDEEKGSNSRSRSAKLRVLERIS